MILDSCFEIPKLEDSILNFQILDNIRNMELKISQHTRKTWLWSVARTVEEDTALLWTLTPANNKKSLYMQNVILTK